MMRGKKSISVFLCLLMALSTVFFVGCSDEPSELAQEMFGFGDDYYKSVESRYTVNYDEMVYDDFTGDTINPDMWVIADTVYDIWLAEHKLQRPQNVFLLKD